MEEWPTFDGPFKWRVEAYGQRGDHESLVLHRIRTKTEKTGRDEWFPVSELGKRADFKPLRGQAGVSRARYPLPGLLKVMPEEDGKLDVWLDLSVIRQSGTTRRLVRFALDRPSRMRMSLSFCRLKLAGASGRSRKIGKIRCGIERCGDAWWGVALPINSVSRVLFSLILGFSVLCSGQEQPVPTPATTSTAAPAGAPAVAPVAAPPSADEGSIFSRKNARAIQFEDPGSQGAHHRS